MRGVASGAREIYFFRDREMPLFLLTAYAKNRKSDLSGAERNGFKLLTRMLAESYRKANR
ncbi:MAG TPA: hypothetical protein VGL35_11380 [Rhizomicrobium sp.]